MKTLHTPGPWHVGSKYPTDVYADRAGHAIARAVNPQHDGECEANARLMRAAPELLEALQDMLRLADAEGWEGFPKARAAIAKATGGAA